MILFEDSAQVGAEVLSAGELARQWHACRYGYEPHPSCACYLRPSQTPTPGNCAAAAFAHASELLRDPSKHH